MEIEIRKVVYEKETINVTFPYYYKYDLMLDDCECIMFGKIENVRETIIQITDNFSHNKMYEVKTKRRAPSTPNLYFAEEYRSTEDEFLAAKMQAAKVILGA